MGLLKRTDGGRILKGTSGELLVQADLLKRGILVFPNRGQVGEDMVIRVGNQYLAIEVTTHPDGLKFKKHDPYWDIIATVDVDTGAIVYYDRNRNRIDPAKFQRAIWSKPSQHGPRQERARGIYRALDAILSSMETYPSDNDEVLLQYVRVELSKYPHLATTVTLNTIQKVRRQLRRQLLRVNIPDAAVSTPELPPATQTVPLGTRGNWKLPAVLAALRAYPTKSGSEIAALISRFDDKVSSQFVCRIRKRLLDGEYPRVP